MLIFCYEDLYHEQHAKISAYPKSVTADFSTSRRIWRGTQNEENLVTRPTHGSFDTVNWYVWTAYGMWTHVS